MIKRETIMEIVSKKHSTDVSCYTKVELVRFMGLYPESFKELIVVDKV